jgi:hypothetical protein
MDRPTWPLGLYCERTTLAFLAEPLNVWTNLAFLAAAIALMRLRQQEAPHDRASLVLIALIGAIGIGSFAFHAAPSRTTVLMDVIPIGLFMLAAIYLGVRRYLAGPWWAGLLALLAFVLAGRLIAEWTGARALRGGAGYLPALAVMPLMAAALWFRAGRLAARARSRKDIAWSAAARPPEDRRPAALHAASRLLLLAGAVFVVSLSARTLDQPFCPQWPFGLHFIWHLLNAIVLFLIVRAHLGFAAIASPAERAGAA